MADETAAAGGPRHRAERGRARKHWTAAWAVTISVGLVAALVLSGSGQGAPASASGSPMAAAGSTPADRMGVFQIKCRWSHAAPDDPIVAPGDPGAAHRHEFYGNVSTDAHSTTSSLTSRGTTCARPQDKAAYWSPTLYNKGTRVQPNLMNAYYRTGPLRDPSVIRPYPLGLRMIAGDAHATTPQSTVVTHWSCADDGPKGTSEPPPSCPGVPLRLKIVFPNCWDGKNLDSADHKSHMAYSYKHDKECPASHPVALPTLKMGLRYDISGPLDRITLASGSRFSGHADFWNAWDPAAQRRLIEQCLLRARTCNSPPLPPRR